MKLQLNESVHLTVMFLYDSPPAKGELEGVARPPLIPPLQGGDKPPGTYSISVPILKLFSLINK